MLRITRFVGDQSGDVLKLEGTLNGPWVSEAQKAHALAAAQTARIRLDLSGLTFANEDGVALLRELSRCGTEIVGCSSFIAELLHLSSASSQT